MIICQTLWNTNTPPRANVIGRHGNMRVLEININAEETPGNTSPVNPECIVMHCHDLFSLHKEN
jgi:hypothetical protein